MTSFDPQIATHLLEMLKAVDHASESWWAIVQSGVDVPGSEESLLAELPLTPHVQAMSGISIGASLDHLRSALLFVKFGEVPTFGPFALIRSSHESALRAYWMLEPGLGDRVRRSRGCAAYLHDLEERRKVEDVVGRPEPLTGKLARDRIVDLLDKAKLENLTHGGKLITSWPNTTKLFEDYEPPLESPGADPVSGDFWWRTLSGLTHGKFWPIVFLNNVIDTPPQGSALGVKSVDISEEFFLTTAERAYSACKRALDAACQFKGVGTI
jgi:hypothetical protein